MKILTAAVLALLIYASVCSVYLLLFGSSAFFQFSGMVMLVINLRHIRTHLAREYARDSK